MVLAFSYPADSGTENPDVAATSEILQSSQALMVHELALLIPQMKKIKEEPEFPTR